MVPSFDSQRSVFRRIAQQSYAEWPAYDSTPLYDRNSLAGLEEDIWTVASTWFDHEAHYSVDEFVSHYPVAYVEFGPHDQYYGATQYEMAQLFRLFLLKELHGWTHETALLTYLTHHPELRELLGIETVPDQSTLWRSWHKRFTSELREGLAANEGARSFVYESTRGRTPLGHAHREHIRDLSIEQIREMYRRAINRLLGEVAETEEFFRAGIVAIDITEAEPFTGDRTGHEDEIIGTKEKTDEYAYQWATVQLVGNAAPIVLDARPVRKGEARKEIVEDLLNSAEDLVHVDNVLMDREFDSQHILEMLSQRGLSYVVPKRMQTSERAQAKRLLQRGQDRYETDRKLHLGKNEWHETTLIYRRKEDSEHDDHRQYSVFMTNTSSAYLTEYGYRWEIESGYKSIK